MTLMGMAARRSPDKILERIERTSPESDRAVLADAGVRRSINEGVAEGFRQGSRGVAYDMRLLSQPWGFPLSDIGRPVHLWQGEQDTTVSTAAARWLAETIPHCHATFIPEAGHLLFYAHLDVVLGALKDPPDGGDRSPRQGE